MDMPRIVPGTSHVATESASRNAWYTFDCGALMILDTPSVVSAIGIIPA
jgi:hypothetical protein